MSSNLIKEITPLTQADCFTLLSRQKKEFDFPLHHHEEYELNLIINASGAIRKIGDHTAVISDLELILIGPHLNHGWFNHESKSQNITEITIHFHRDIFHQTMLNRNQFSLIRNMFERSHKGILFSPETIDSIKPLLLSLEKKTGFHALIDLCLIFHELSIAPDSKTLSKVASDNETLNYNSRRIEKVFEYMNLHYALPVTLAEVSKVANMPEASFSRFIKNRTGITFIDSLNEIRLGHASRMLIDSHHTIADIAFKCGFTNISNFNRIFKRRKNTTPTEFRDNHAGNRIFI